MYIYIYILISTPIISSCISTQANICTSIFTNKHAFTFYTYLYIRLHLCLKCVWNKNWEAYTSVRNNYNHTHTQTHRLSYAIESSVCVHACKKMHLFIHLLHAWKYSIHPGARRPNKQTIFAHEYTGTHNGKCLHATGTYSTYTEQEISQVNKQMKRFES